MTEERSLEVQRQEFSERRFLAVPLAGTTVWTVIVAIYAVTIVIPERRWRALQNT